MKLNLNYQLKDLAGKSVQGEQANASKALAGALASANKGNAIKLMDWALKFWSCKAVELDKTDKEFLEGFVETTEMLTALTKVSILDSIKEQYEKQK
jgi:hypothetical protein